MALNSTAAPALFYDGVARAKALILTGPLSFWGGIDPLSGKIIAVRHDQCGQSITGRALFMPSPIGSSSSSAVLLELIRNGHAPACIILGEADAILVVGCLVAREMRWFAPPVLLDPTIKENPPPDGSTIIVSGGRWHVAAD